jgi:hypothetical protein
MSRRSAHFGYKPGGPGFGFSESRQSVVSTTGAWDAEVTGWDAGSYRIAIQTLAGDSQSSNPGERVDLCHPTSQPAQDGTGVEQHEFPPHSLSLVRWERK